MEKLITDFNNARRLTQDNQFEDAVCAYETILLEHPEHVPSHYNLGQLAAKLGNIASARAHFETVLRLAPTFAQGYFQLAQILLVENKPIDAIEQLKQAIFLQADYFDALHLLACTALQQKQYHLAEQAFETLLPMGPYHASSHLNYALLKFQLEEIDAAKQLLDKALALDPTLIEAHYHRGVIAMQQGDHERAMLEMQETLDRNKDHFSANYNLAILYKMQQQFKLAIFYLKKAQSLQPDNESVGFLLAAFEHTCPDKAPESFVIELFNHYASTYDAHMEKVLHYKTPKQMRNLLIPFQHLLPSHANILDLGCGTGLVAHYFNDINATWIGVDLSHEMLTQAKKRNQYAELQTCDIEIFLNHEQRKYDLIIASEVFNYFGPLEQLITACKKVLNSQGLLLFSIELNDEHDYDLHTYARFAHHSAYIDAITQHTWRMLAEQTVTLRAQENTPVKGKIFLFQTNE